MKPILAALIFGTLLLSAPAPAAAHEDSRLDPMIQYALTAVPGGIALDTHHAVWPDGMELHVPEPLSKAVLNCPTMRICAFSGASTSGAMLSWSTCGTHSTAALATVGSIANARTSGILQARNGSTVVATASAGSWANVFSTITNVRCLQ